MEQLKIETQKAIERIKNKEINHTEFKDIICNIAQLLETLCANLPQEIPFVIKEIICLLASLAKSLCKILSDK